MNKTVIIGVNENPAYLYYIPLIAWAWDRYGWRTRIMYVNNHNIDYNEVDGDWYKVTDDPFMSLIKKHNPWTTKIKYVRKDRQSIKKYDSVLISQLSRMYGYDSDSKAWMTSDADMLPLSNYFNHDINQVTCYGRDLSNEHYPMCYVSMPWNIWFDGLTYTGRACNKLEEEILETIKDRKDANSADKSKRWVTDQNIITEKLLSYGVDRIVHINRGTDKRTGYPLGRVDRSNWRLDHDQLIDCHLPHDILTNDESFRKVMQLLHLVWPKEDFKWMLEYHREFKKLL